MGTLGTKDIVVPLVGVEGGGPFGGAGNLVPRGGGDRSSPGGFGDPVLLGESLLVVMALGAH